MVVRISYQSGNIVETAEIDMPVTALPQLKSSGIFALAKAGSVLVHKVAGQLFSEVGVPVIDWPALCYARGIDLGSIQGNLSEIFPAHGYCMAGFRELPRAFLGAPSLKDLRKILVVRDPRDMLVSRYYSTKFSHGFQEFGTPQFSHIMRQFRDDARLELDEFCLSHSWWINADLFAYSDVASQENTLVLRYEDFIYDKSKLVFGMAKWCGLNISSERLAEIAKENEVIPTSEDSGKHVRQAHPGDFSRKLKPETIASLNHVLRGYMRTFGYSTECPETVVI